MTIFWSGPTILSWLNKLCEALDPEVAGHTDRERTSAANAQVHHTMIVIVVHEGFAWLVRSNIAHLSEKEDLKLNQKKIKASIDSLATCYTKSWWQVQGSLDRVGQLPSRCD